MKLMKLSKPLGLPVPELRGSLKGIGYPAFGEIKFDGEFTHIIFKDDKIVTCNKYNKIRSQFPALNQIKNVLRLGGVKSAIMLAELYYGEGKRNALYDLNSNKESDDLNLYVFDILEHDGQDLTQSELIDRKELLGNILPDLEPTEVVCDEAEANKFFKAVVDGNYEGVVIKPLNSRLNAGPMNWVKLKMKDQNDYPVTFIDQTKERIEVTVFSMHTSKGPITKPVGIKAPTRYKRHITLGDLVTIEHQGMLESGSLRHPVLIPKKGW